MPATQDQIDARFRRWRRQHPDGVIQDHDCFSAGYRAAEKRACRNLALAQVAIARLRAALTKAEARGRNAGSVDLQATVT